MDRADRAKQFMPFDALKGFREALKEKEKVTVPKIELSEYARDELDRKLHQVEKNDIVTVVYFCEGEYLKITGMVARLDTTARILRIVNTKISFDDIYDIQGDKIAEPFFSD
ncbi:MAG: YolD-like family protein [Lachnospiraceae bacterium]